ncbi:splicing factor U2AF subunit isoform B [Alligator mississippiensis]|uniref:Splicing factor U2AF subunit isoform B n=1 Tax=Alligator mississippiensis TaxID=8496 RepID=A0A151NQM2_ALLMI|nr:splicing factor U2AF subunit isoform B [Alligator mississippiensis]
MAEYLASIFGTEKDKVNCSFYFKIGACRHGDRCSRLHNKPTFSQTIALLNIYRNPQNSSQSADGLRCAVSDVEMQEHYDEFFEEVFTEMEEKYGEVEEMNVCDNLGDHLVGNVYVKFRREEDAEKAVIDLNNRWFNGQPIHAELSPVTDFREACCRQYEMGECTRGGFCNFMHLKPISRELRRELYGRRRKKWQRKVNVTEWQEASDKLVNVKSAGAPLHPARARCDRGGGCRLRHCREGKKPLLEPLEARRLKRCGASWLIKSSARVLHPV